MANKFTQKARKDFRVLAPHAGTTLDYVLSRLFKACDMIDSLRAELKENQERLREIKNLCENCRSLSDAIYIAEGRINTSTQSGCDKCWVEKLETKLDKAKEEILSLQAEKSVADMGFVSEGAARRIRELKAGNKYLRGLIKELCSIHNRYAKGVTEMLVEQGFKVDYKGGPTVFD